MSSRLFMKRTLIVLLAITTPCLFSFSQNYRGGIVYGPKAAFNIAAPEGWVLDNESGKEQGMRCVMYPGFSKKPTRWIQNQLGCWSISARSVSK
jgi:hypothetical protein